MLFKTKRCSPTYPTYGLHIVMYTMQNRSVDAIRWLVVVSWKSIRPEVPKTTLLLSHIFKYNNFGWIIAGLVGITRPLPWDGGRRNPRNLLLGNIPMSGLEIEKIARRLKMVSSEVQWHGKRGED